MMMEEELLSYARKYQTRYDNNLSFFEKHIPALHRQIIEHKGKPELIINPENGELSISLSGKNIYPEGAVNQAMSEVKDFINKVDNGIYTPPASTFQLGNLIKNKAFIKSNKLYEKITATEEPLKNLRASNMDVVIFGVGLGYHIEMLINKDRFSHITIIENDMCTFKASMHAVDWENILKNLRSNKHCTFLISDNPQLDKNFLRELRNQCIMLFPSISISTIIYNHRFQTEIYKEIKKVLNEFGGHIRLVSEKLAPDAHRLFNVNENIRNNYPAIDLQNSKYNGSKLIAVSGSGPSLDLYADIIKENREKIILISAGSTLSSLLKMGIKPDLHFELEFQKLASDLLTHLNKSYDLSEFDLVSTYEANPIYPKLFKNKFMFIPESSDLVSRFPPFSVLRGGGVTCTNGAAALALELTQSEIYLFGADFAYTGNKHHSETNISNESELPSNLEHVSGKRAKKANIVVKDTSGNDIYTTQGLNSARLAMESLADISQKKIFNCSYGASIKGSIYLSREGLKNKLEKIKNDESKIEIIASTIDSSKIHNDTRKIYKTTFDECRNIKKTVSSFGNSSFDNYYSIKVIFSSLYHKFKLDLGQYRNIMSMNKLPLLQLSLMVNFLPDEQQKRIIKTWLKDYDAYVNHVETKFNKMLDNEDFFVEDEWLSHR